MDIIGKKNLYFLISILVVIPGLISLLLFGLNPSIDFTSGSLLTLQFSKNLTDKQIQDIKTIYTKEKIDLASVQKIDKGIIIRSKPIDSKKHTQLTSSLKKQLGDYKEENFQTIGPTVGSETTWNAIKAVVLASFLIVLYVAWSFREVPKPASSFRFGVSAVLALIHDVLVVLGIFSLLGHFFGVQVDSLFVTAVLTVIGFSVHDTIVVFDRIRENLKRMPGTAFSEVVNESILQTLDRSLNTSFTVLLVLLALLLFGGESIRWFVVALFIGILSGTYSSIFNAAPILVVWHNWAGKRIKNHEL